VEKLLALHEVTAGYGASTPAELSAVELSISAGEIVAVLGPNGAGKTTLVRVASGLLTPRRGTVELMGRPLAALRRAEVARVLAVVEQMPSVLGDFTVREVVAMGRAPHQGGWMQSTNEDVRVVDEVLARCELVALAGRPARALSGGEQKRVAVGRALAQEPRVLLLDEPGAFLDVRHQLDLYELLAALVRERRMACLVVMHDLNVAAQFADRVVLMRDGSVVGDGPASDVMTEPVLRRTFDVDLVSWVDERAGARFFLPRRRQR
jgi:iron complex transport system ATP-binding protein